MPHRSKPSTKLDPSQSEALSHRRTKRLRIDSEEDEDEGYEQQERHTGYSESYARGHDSPDAGNDSKRPRHIADSPDNNDDGERDYAVNGRRSNEREGDGEYDGGGGDGYGHEYDGYGERPGKRRRSSTSSPSRMHNSPLPVAPGPSSGQGTRVRKSSIKALTSASGSATKKPTMKGKQKAQHSASTTANKRRKRPPEGEDDEEDYQDSDDDEVELGDEEEDEARFSDEYEEGDKRPPRGKRGRAGGKGAQGREKVKEKDMAPILKRAKFEGNHAALASTGGTKRPRTKRAADDMLVDVVGDTGTPEPSSIGSPTTSNPTVDGTKDDVSTSAQPLPKKPKLPTIKKLKSSASTGGGTGPSTPSSITAQGSKPPTIPPPPLSTVAGSGVNKLGISESTKPPRPKTNATSDLDLSNPSLYAELFKNPAGNASKTGLNRRAKEEERRKELDKMRDEYKVKIMEEAKVSFDLQGQAEKVARFEEVLRRRLSSALYPNFLAAKWREEWEREKRRAHKREYQQHQQQNVDANNAKEEGEM